MKFVVVSDRAARAGSACAHCSSSIDAGYLRHLPTARLYCDYACYLGQHEDVRQQAGFNLRHQAFTGVAVSGNS
jgi:hypothetical protein